MACRARKEILQKARFMVEVNFDIFAFGDSLPSPHLANHASHVYAVIDRPHIPPPALVVRRSLWHFPSYMLFDDFSLNLSLHTYTSILKQVLLMATKAHLGTETVIAIGSLSNPPNPVLCPLLDRHIGFSQNVVLHNVIYNVRKEENGEFVWFPLFSKTPMVPYQLRCTSRIQRIVAPLVEQLFLATFDERVPVPPCEAMHIGFHAPKFVKRADRQSVEPSPLRFLMPFDAWPWMFHLRNFYKCPARGTLQAC